MSASNSGEEAAAIVPRVAKLVFSVTVTAAQQNGSGDTTWDWMFMGASAPYTIFSGLGELARARARVESTNRGAPLRLTFGPPRRRAI